MNAYLCCLSELYDSSVDKIQGYCKIESLDAHGYHVYYALGWGKTVGCKSGRKSYLSRWLIWLRCCAILFAETNYTIKDQAQISDGMEKLYYGNF